MGTHSGNIQWEHIVGFLHYILQYVASFPCSLLPPLHHLRLLFSSSLSVAATQKGKTGRGGHGERWNIVGGSNSTKSLPCIHIAVDTSPQGMQYKPGN